MADTHVAAGAFAPRALIPVSVGRFTINLYPVVDRTMSVQERAHAFQINKTALLSLALDLRVMLDALGAQLDLSASVEGMIEEWLRLFQDSWFDFNHLTILSFHSDTGAQVNDTTEDADPAVLLPLVNGNLDTCRKAIKFVRVQLSLSYRSLATTNLAGPTVLRATYYIELPLTLVGLMHGNNVRYSILTFNGANDLRTLTPAEVRAELLDQTLQTEPLDLLPPSYNVRSARTESAVLKADIDQKIMKLACPTICATFFTELCPGYSSQPHAALEHIRQVHQDSSGNQVVSTVQSYYQQIMSAARPFYSQQDFPVSVCQKFMDGLDTRLQVGFRRNFSDHSVVQSLEGSHQRRTLQLMLKAAQQAEDDFASTQRIARDAVGLSQAFQATVHTAGASVASLPSQAESTIRKYSPNSGGRSDGSTEARARGPPRPIICYGCGGPHVYTEFQNGQHVVVCVNRNNPGVAENAQRTLERMRKNKKKRYNNNLKRKNLNTVNLSDFSEEQRARLSSQWRTYEATGETSVVSLVTGPSTSSVTTPPRRKPGSGSVIFMIDVPCLANGSTLKRMMPITIQSNLPHIVLQFGPDTDTADCPSIRCAVDTCAALSTGNFHFFLAVAKRYPHCLAKLLAPADYAPIVLSGIVQHQDSAVTTELEVGFQFHLPYRTTGGDSSSLLVATGPHVSVNTIIGLPFIKATGMILDFVDDVAECKHLDCPPFRIDYRRTSNHVPVSPPSPDVPIHHLGPHEKSVLEELSNLERWIDAKVIAPYSSAQSPSVHFGSKSAVRAYTPDLASVSTDATPTSIATRWVPPSSMPPDDSTDDYHHQILREDGYLPSCLKSSHDSASSNENAPIRVTPKPKRRKRLHNVFLDDRGFPDVSDEYDHVLHDIHGGPILRKLRHPKPDLSAEIDPLYYSPFIAEKHEAIMRRDMDLSHLEPALQERIYDVIRRHWSVFDEKGVFVPVKFYECVIDTGTSPPIAVKRVLYGEKESEIMRKAISALEKVGHIKQITDGGWLFKALLAAKPHQEHVRSIDEFVWRFCVNYIPLNAVTRLIAYPIPRCDSAVHNEFGQGQWRWMFDAPMGYHQLAVAPSSQEKLAFQGPDAIKWTYTVMPFGPTNGPATFVNFIHDIDSVWKELANDRGVPIDDDTNTRIIIDDIVSWAKLLERALAYMECQLKVCQAYRLSLNLQKSHIFPSRFEFVGIDVSAAGNRPAQSKHSLLKTWPAPETVRDVAKFIGFAQFYSRFIHNFELRIAPLRVITKEEYTDPVAPYWTDAAHDSMSDIKNAILSDPCILRFDYRKLIVLRTDFSCLGFGWVLCQPGDDAESAKAVQDYRDGKGFSFMTKESLATLRPVCFGGRKTRGNEVRLHSHLGEIFAGDYGMNKCRHMLFGQRFVWVTDCYAAKFVLTYEGPNPAILRLQMRLMCWDVDIVHRPDVELVDADYWSRLGVDIAYDPLLLDYLKYTMKTRVNHPPPTDLPMRPENMPYYRGPRIQNPKEASDPSPDAMHIQALLTDIIVHRSTGNAALFVIPVRFGTFAAPASPPKAEARVLHNSEFARYARMSLQFDWAVYSFSSGHFCSTILNRNLPFAISLACDPYESGRALFQEFAPTAKVFGLGNDLLNHIRASGKTSPLQGYLINSYRFQSSEITSSFWKLQLSIIAQLRLIRSLSTVVAVIIRDHDRRVVTSFVKGLNNALWKVETMDISYDAIGDSVSDSCTILTAVHSACCRAASPLQLKAPPAVPPRPIGAFLWEPFDRDDHSLCPSRDDAAFNKDDSNKMIVTRPKQADASSSRTIKIKYHLHRADRDPSILAGTSVLSHDSLCPPFESCPNHNLFQQYFGIEFNHKGSTHVRAISTFKFTRCFGLVEQVQYRMSHERHRYGLDAAMPGRTSEWLFEQVLSHLIQIRDDNSEVFLPNQFAAPAATIQTLVNGAICSRLPSHDHWLKAYDCDRELCIVRDLILNPSQISTESLAKVNHNYRNALQRSQLCIEDGMLILREPIAGCDSYTRLQLVPQALYNTIFVAFHANAIGGHLNAYKTLHRIRLRYYWPAMWAYIQRMCRACPGCALSNPTRNKSSELVYGFPIEAPFLVMHFDAYSAGKHSGFEGSDVYLIGCCGMCGFACMEPVSNPSATTFASAIMKILLRYGFCHTSVLDKDSKFFGVCREALDLLKINCHVLSGGNHNPMLVERVNRYLNKGLKIMTNERESVRIALEAILLLLYAWNSCPIPGTDISRSLVAVGREFAFPIDYSTGKHWELVSSPNTVTTYSKDLAMRLTATRAVAELLVKEHRDYHREFINAQRPNPRVYAIGDIVFARRAVRSDKRRERVDKLQYAFTGPWKVVSVMPGASYQLEHCEQAGRKEKKHASDLSPYPPELVPFQPVDGPDTRFGQLYKPIAAHPFKEAGIKGFTPPTPYQIAHPANLVDIQLHSDFHWPSLSELNESVAPFQWESDDEYQRYLADDSFHSEPVMATGPPPSAPKHAIPTVPAIHLLIAAIIRSTDRLFFVSNSIGANNSREWRLVRIAFEDSMSLYPSCTQDGRFLVEFYICHTADWRMNAVNQRYWLQYHEVSDIESPHLASMTHLIKPSEISASYATRHKLVPLRKWMNLTHLDTYIHGPFDFASIRGRKTRDRIDQVDWDILQRHSSMFGNPIPSFDVPTYSVHFDRGAHDVVVSKAHCDSLLHESSIRSSATPSDRLYP